MKDFLIEMPEENPFKNDRFDRKSIVDNFMNIIENIDESLIISIDSGFGTGKTTLIKMWELFINNSDEFKDKYETLYFNAWSNDYMEDPLIAILSEIEINDKSQEGSTLEAVKNFGKKISKPVISTALKIATSGLINIDSVELGDNVERYLPELAGKLGDALVNDAVKSKETRSLFKERMINFQDESNKKVLFFIDELDRCKPQFAIELLETIKHLFDMKNFIFIVSLDKEQLSHSIATIYGQGMDTDGYLRRFFDFNFELPDVNKTTYIDYKNMEISAKYKGAYYFQEFLKRFMIEYNFSLRDIDKTYNYVHLLMPLVREFRDRYNADIEISTGYLYALLISLKIKKPGGYKKIINCKYANDKSEYEKLFNISRIYNMNWNGFKDIQNGYILKMIQNILELYLDLNYKIYTGYRLELLNKDEYNAGVNGEGICILELFREGKNNICNNMEFINRFN